uniref:Uncharacterized protein n=1 Tax=Panagrolaimus superbus TaxID=310955 RepID=A0A914YTM2_9BILA
MIFDIQNLTFGIFKKIVECTEILRLSNTKIYFSDDTIAHFEDILPCIPNAYFIYIFKCCYVSPRTEKMLLLIKRNPKFSTFEINYIEGDVDTDKFWEFVVKNIQPRARVEICWGYPEIM